MDVDVGFRVFWTMYHWDGHRGGLEYSLFLIVTTMVHGDIAGYGLSVLTIIIK